MSNVGREVVDTISLDRLGKVSEMTDILYKEIVENIERGEDGDAEIKLSFLLNLWSICSPEGSDDMISSLSDMLYMKFKNDVIEGRLVDASSTFDLLMAVWSF